VAAANDLSLVYHYRANGNAAFRQTLVGFFDGSL
jgi:hypothetical protein